MINDYFDLRLGEFDQEYFDNLPDYSRIVPPDMSSEMFYHTIYVDGEKAGVVGFIPMLGQKDTGFAQIVLAPEIRGRGLIENAYEALAERHDLKTLYVTIRKDNLIALSAHEKIGFVRLSEEKLKNLRERGLIAGDEVRYMKEF